MTHTNPPQTEKAIFKTLTFIHFAFCFAVLIFGLAAIVITEKASIYVEDRDDLFFYFVPLFAITLAFVGNFLFQLNLKKIKENATLKEKLAHYQTAKLIQFAMTEGPALFGISVFLISANQYYLIISAVFLAYLVFLRPTKTAIKDHLNLNAEQVLEFRKVMS